MIEIDMKMPSCCDDCFALDFSGDYPCCIISEECQGYNFNVYENRMPSCPLKEREPVIVSTQGWVCPKCGTVYGPFILSCYRCSKPMQVTCTD